MTVNEFENTPAPGVPSSPPPLAPQSKLISVQGPLLHPPTIPPPAGTALTPSPPHLFTPLTIRGLTLQNRIMVSPMCQYSASSGATTPWHLTHLGAVISRGPGLTIIEATAVSPEGRITPQCTGLWKDSQIDGIREIAEFAHSQGQKVGIQIAHAGRKASMVAPWMSWGQVAGEELGGWPKDVVGPSALAYDDCYNTFVPSPPLPHWWVWIADEKL